MGVGRRQVVTSTHARTHVATLVAAAAGEHARKHPSLPSPPSWRRRPHLVPEAGGLGGVPGVGHGVGGVHHVAVRRGRKLQAQPEHVHEVDHLLG